MLWLRGILDDVIKKNDENATVSLGNMDKVRACCKKILLRTWLGGTPTVWLCGKGHTGTSQAAGIKKSRMFSQAVRTLSHSS